jgi:hypothetical protein
VDDDGEVDKESELALALTIAGLAYKVSSTSVKLI